MRIFLQHSYVDLRIFPLSGYNHIIFAGYITINCKRIDILAEAYPSDCNNDQQVEMQLEIWLCDIQKLTIDIMIRFSTTPKWPATGIKVIKRNELWMSRIDTASYENFADVSTEFWRPIDWLKSLQRPPAYITVFLYHSSFSVPRVYDKSHSFLIVVKAYDIIQLISVDFPLLLKMPAGTYSHCFRNPGLSVGNTFPEKIYRDTYFDVIVAEHVQDR